MNFPFLRSALKLYSMDNAHRVSLRPCCFVRLDVDSVTATLDKKTKKIVSIGRLQAEGYAPERGQQKYVVNYWADFICHFNVFAKL